MLTLNTSLLMKSNSSKTLCAVCVCVLNLCPFAFHVEASPTPCYPSSCKNTIFTRDLSQAYIWLCNSFKDQPLAHQRALANPKLAYFFVIHSKPHQSHMRMHTQRQSQQTHLRPMHELTKWLSQLQWTKLFSFKLFFFILLWNESFQPVDPQASCCPSVCL